MTDALPPPELPSAVAIAELATQSSRPPASARPCPNESPRAAVQPPSSDVAAPAGASAGELDESGPEQSEQATPPAESEQATRPAEIAQPDAPLTGQAAGAVASAVASEQPAQPPGAGADEAEPDGSADSPDIARALQAAEDIAAEESPRCSPPRWTTSAPRTTARSRAASCGGPRTLAEAARG